TCCAGSLPAFFRLRAGSFPSSAWPEPTHRLLGLRPQAVEPGGAIRFRSPGLGTIHSDARKEHPMPEQAKSALVLHCGAREVTREELARVATPTATETWFPVSHDTCVATVQESLTAAGFEIRQMRFGLARNDARMFATVDLASPLATGVSLAVGI